VRRRGTSDSRASALARPAARWVAWSVPILTHSTAAADTLGDAGLDLAVVVRSLWASCHAQLSISRKRAATPLIRSRRAPIRQVGLGGGAIMVPLMTRFAGFSQHAAVGTSSAAVAVTGLFGCASFSTAGAVDLPAAAAVALTAMVGARLGAKLTKRFDSNQLAKVRVYLDYIPIFMHFVCIELVGAVCVCPSRPLK